MKIFSSCLNFWDTEKFADYGEVREVDLGDLSLGQQISNEIFFKDLEGKKVLMIIHGYNNVADDICKAYWTIQNAINSIIIDSNGEKVYDEVIGYIWPGEDTFFEYFKAKANAGSAAFHLRYWLNEMFKVSPNVELDLMSHSMGSRTALTALNISENNVKIRNAFMMASAVDNESIEPNQEYNKAVNKCDKFYIFHSVNDGTLKFAYRFAEFDYALGFAGPEDISVIQRKMKNVKVVNCKNIVKQHGDYKRADHIYKYIKSELTNNYSKYQFTTL